MLHQIIQIKVSIWPEIRNFVNLNFLKFFIVCRDDEAPTSQSRQQCFDYTCSGVTLITSITNGVCCPCMAPLIRFNDGSCRPYSDCTPPVPPPSSKWMS